MWPEIDIVKNENKRELNLSGAEISRRIDSSECEGGLDKILFELTSLNLLNINETTLKLIPNEIGNLINLQTLLLYGNELTTLPTSIGTLSKLKVLDCSRNKLTNVSIEITQLINLTTINLSNNQLIEFPKLDKLIKLSTLDLSNNRLTKFPNICSDQLSNLSEINLKYNEITEIPHKIQNLINLKHFNMSENKIISLPKSLGNITKLKDLVLLGNPIKDKRLLKLIQQCGTKQITDYVKQHGTVVSNDDDQNSVSDTEQNDKTDNGIVNVNKQQRPKAKDRKSRLSEPSHTIIIKRHTDESIKMIYMDGMKDVRPFILCCTVKDVNLSGTNYKTFLQIQNTLHTTVCGSREKSTIATHDLSKIKGNLVKYTCYPPKQLKIIPLGRSNKVTAEKFYEDLKADAEAVRKSKKRNTYSSIHKYLYLLEHKEIFACLEDDAGVISLPPLTNSDMTKISPETKDILIEVSSTTSINDCRTTMNKLIEEMLKNKLTYFSNNDCSAGEESVKNGMIIQQVKITDIDGNLRMVYPSKTDLLLDESFVTIVRE